MAAAIPSNVSKWVDVGVSFGAALVIWGALRKIIHAQDAEIWLWIGLTTEAIIFTIYGILYIVYPPIETAGSAEDSFVVGGARRAVPATSNKLDLMLAEANITPELMQRLSDGFHNLNNNVMNMGQLADAVSVTNEFAAKTKEATKHLDNVVDAYSSAAQGVGAFNSITEGAKVFHNQIQNLSQNLSSLNTIYELELNESNNHLKALNSFYGKLAEASGRMTQTVDDAGQVHNQIGQLATHLTQLNHMYGGMIAAMQMKK